jgi:hypothetical protein
VEGFRATFSSHAADVSRAAPTVQAQGSEAFRELLGNREMSCGCCSGHRSVAWLKSGMRTLTMAPDLGVLRSSSFGIDTQLILTFRRSASRIWSGVIIHRSNSAFRKQAPLKLHPFIRTSEKSVCEKSVPEQSALKKVADDI